MLRDLLFHRTRRPARQLDQGTVHLHEHIDLVTAQLPTPKVYGMKWLTWAITNGALRTASIMTPTEVPILNRPSGPGGLTWIRTTSTG